VNETITPQTTALEAVQVHVAAILAFGLGDLDSTSELFWYW